MRLRLVLPRIILPQQTGFVPGRNILENISIAWLTRDWLHHTGLPALFLKLDFEKAFDRIEHSYIWETLKQLGFGDLFIALVKGLIEDSFSKIHVNGLFSEEISL